MPAGEELGGQSPSAANPLAAVCPQELTSPRTGPACNKQCGDQLPRSHVRGAAPGERWPQTTWHEGPPHSPLLHSALTLTGGTENSALVSPPEAPARAALTDPPQDPPPRPQPPQNPHHPPPSHDPRAPTRGCDPGAPRPALGRAPRPSGGAGIPRGGRGGRTQQTLALPVPSLCRVREALPGPLRPRVA